MKFLIDKNLELHVHVYGTHSKSTSHSHNVLGILTEIGDEVLVNRKAAAPGF